MSTESDLGAAAEAHDRVLAERNEALTRIEAYVEQVQCLEKLLKDYEDPLSDWLRRNPGRGTDRQGRHVAGLAMKVLVDQADSATWFQREAVQLRDLITGHQRQNTETLEERRLLRLVLAEAEAVVKHLGLSGPLGALCASARAVVGNL
jgi:hypothetical protein